MVKSSGIFSIAIAMLAAVMLMAFVVVALIGFHTAATNNHQAMHHAQDTAHLAINGGQEPRGADLATWGGRGPSRAKLVTVGVRGPSRADLATVMFPIIGGQRPG